MLRGVAVFSLCSIVIDDRYVSHGYSSNDWRSLKTPFVSSLGASTVLLSSCSVRGRWSKLERIRVQRAGCFFVQVCNRLYQCHWKTHSISAHANVHLCVHHPPKENANRETQRLLLGFIEHPALTTDSHGQYCETCPCKHEDRRPNQESLTRLFLTAVFDPVF